ncbi:unnamed protein product [Didymodactylos carnosus]|uniref:SWIM-type domain-containing protein n=2 Tax=Didymodactylos carnosus TaxID=1234261 RepID=A0A815HAS2_9BILA|nr:unnamed protein product [Didymodactylos carnosus]CAF4222005.1 unnamed protein product [Didymodactylos carnosus]
MGIPSTNNGLESSNGKIKEQYTLRVKLNLSSFLPTMQQMLSEWSSKSTEEPFHTFPVVSVAQEKEALTWLQSLDKKTILHWYGNSYIVPSTFNHQYNSMLWLQEYSTLPWTQWDNFPQWLKAGRLITIPMTCSCRSNLKTYVCKHAIGLMMHFGCNIVKDPVKLQNFQKRRGRPRKVGNALSGV